MTIAITCTCSARLEVDERFAGSTITCPDCQKSLDVPAAGGPAKRTSGLALTSIILALAGAFTLLGTVLAVICGVVALLVIRRDPKRLTGARFALAGIILGVVLTGLSLFAYSSTELFGVDSILRQTQWIGRLEFPSDLETTGATFKIKRPSSQWGVLITSPSPTAVSSGRTDVMFVLPTQSAYIVCLTGEVQPGTDFDQCQEQGLEMFRTLDISQNALQKNANLQVTLKRENKKIWKKEENTRLTWFAEMTVEKKFHGQTRTFLVRIVKKEEDQRFGPCKYYVIAGGGPAARFASLKKEIHEALDSFQLLE